MSMNEQFEELFGPMVGQGAQATVYAKNGFAVKLYRKGYPKRNVFSEAYIMANLEQEDFPAPKVYEVLFVDGRYGIRMDRVKGTMMSEYLAHPQKTKETLDALIALQCRLQQQTQVGLWAPELKLRFRGDLIRNKELTTDIREHLLARLDRLPDGDAFCHCDFHSGNVFFDGEHYTVIDLLQVCKGNPAADAACSFMSYSLIHSELAAYYVQKYSEVSAIPKEQVMQWLPVYAGTLWGQLPKEYMPMIEQFITETV